MPRSMLFGISNEGKVFGLPTDCGKWREFPYLGLEFKKISAVPCFLWALGGDRQIYLYVNSLDVPIRIKEEVYENERWFIIEGFGKRFLPTDRYRWSNKDGTVERRKESVKLPSMAWQWEGDWQLELTLDGYPLDYDGWTYAIDFPASYHPTKHWSSCVRRRKWYRYRRYGSMYAWCAISPLYEDPTKEPFVDVSIGGYNKIDESKGVLSVWAVTVNGRIMFRCGVSTECPDGVRWLHVPSPKNFDIVSASCSALGVLWIVLRDGRAAVRYGITTQCPTGETWLEIPPPEKNLKLVQISIGLNSVWAITDDNRIWYRKGTRADRNNTSERLLVGSGWTAVLGEMVSISVSANDQVFAVSKKDKRIYYRSGIDGTDHTGKKWLLIEARTLLKNSNSRPSTSTTNVPSSSQGDSGHSSMTSESDEKSSKSAPPYGKSHPTLLTEPPRRLDEKHEIGVKSWGPDRTGSELGMEASPDIDDSNLDTETQKQVFREKDDLSIACKECKTLWCCVCAGAVNIDSLNLPKWFVNDSLIDHFNKKEPWRSKILMKLRIRNLSSRGFDYKNAIETTSWTQWSKFKVHLPASQVTVECILELEWIENTDGPDSGSLAVLSCTRNSSLLQICLSEITCILNCSEPNQPCFLINTIQTVKSGISPLKIFFNSENDFEDWFDCVSAVCYQVNNIPEIPHDRSIWCTTALGDIYVSDTELFRKNQVNEIGRYIKRYNVKNYSEPYRISLLNGFPVNSEITINGHIPANTDRFSINLVCRYNNDVALHFNPRFDQQVIVRNSNIGGNWGIEEREGLFNIPRCNNFTLTILCLEKKFKILLNELTFTYYQHRLSPANITDIEISGGVDIFDILYETSEVVIDLPELFWRKIRGNLRKVETCRVGITWGIGYNNVPWVYSKNSSQTNQTDKRHSTFTMVDTKNMFVYENQRGNLLTGYIGRGLPTDRPMWSDESGRENLTKDGIKLQNMHWQWITEWKIDYQTPGGVDQDGWQYAVDFPATYHPTKKITDTARRRRWVRTCRIVIPDSPWQEVGNTQLKDVSLSILDETPDLKRIAVWGVTDNGEVLCRNGVTNECPSGESWEHVQTDEPMRCISVGSTRQVWCCDESGISYWRFGITPSNPLGENWHYVEPINGCIFRKVAVGKWTVWALDDEGDLYVRKEITAVFPEGTHWRKVQNNDDNKFKHICASEENIWVLTTKGVFGKRIGISEDHPEGVSWIYGLSGNWLYLSE